MVFTRSRASSFRYHLTVEFDVLQYTTGFAEAILDLNIYAEKHAHMLVALTLCKQKIQARTSSSDRMMIHLGIVGAGGGDGDSIGVAVVGAVEGPGTNILMSSQRGTSSGDCAHLAAETRALATS